MILKVITLANTLLPLHSLPNCRGEERVQKCWALYFLKSPLCTSPPSLKNTQNKVTLPLQIPHLPPEPLNPNSFRENKYLDNNIDKCNYK